MGKKSKTENTGSLGHYKPRMAADRTENLWKHQCIHCRGWTPCDSEGLAWLTPSDDPCSRPESSELSDGRQAATHDGSKKDCDVDDVAHTGEGNEWRDAHSADGENP